MTAKQKNMRVASAQLQGGDSGDLHLIKLCVGAESVEELLAWQKTRLADRRAAGLAPYLTHRTRMAPKRAEELLRGGSLYWVIKGRVQARQTLLGIEPADGAKGVDLILAPELVRTVPQPRRPFQGWRYLPGTDAPADLTATAYGCESSQTTLPPVLREAVAEYGVL